MIACVSVPYFAAAIERRQDTGLMETPLAIGGQHWEARPIYAFSREVARMGVKAGMSLRLAHVLSPEAHFMPAGEVTYGDASAEMVDVLLDFADGVETEELWHPFQDDGSRSLVIGRTLPARYSLDLTGLPSGETPAFLQHLGRTVQRLTTLTPAVGCAPHWFAAQVAATVSRPQHVLPVVPGAESDFLANRSIHFLPLEREMARRLRLLGIRTLGQFARISQIALQEQFGSDILPLYRLARGAGEPVRRPLQQATVWIEKTHEFSAPLYNWRPLTAILHKDVEEIVFRLQKKNQAAQMLRLAWETEQGDRETRHLPLRQAATTVRHLKAGLAALLQQAVFSEGIVQLTVGVGDLLPQRSEQISLFDTAAASPPFQEALPALTARYGPDCFWRPLLSPQPHPLPERRFQLQAIAHDPAVA